MILSPFATPFFCCSSPSSLSKRDVSLSEAAKSLSHFDYNLFCNLLSEWESHPLLSSCLSHWKSLSVCQPLSVNAPLLILSFNVRGFNSRWQEVLLLNSSYAFDIMILQETGDVETSLCAQAFPKFRCFHQRGENRNGGVSIMVRKEVQASRVVCDLPNICAVDIHTHTNDTVRIIGVYAPESRSWGWDHLSQFLSTNCAIFGDFNVDLEQDGGKADLLLSWADTHNLAPYTPVSATSLRAERTIDFSLSNLPLIEIQTYVGNTTSDHRPLLSVLPPHVNKNTHGITVHWNVFTLFTKYTSEYWEARWCTEEIDETYSDYTQFLALLEARCTVHFALEKYRIAIPTDLRCAMSFVRAMSFRQKRNRDADLKNLVRHWRKYIKYALKNFVASRLSSSLRLRFSATSASVSFWSKVKRGLKPNSSSLRALISPSGEVVKDAKGMCETAADHYEALFRKVENIVRPHPYLDAPPILHDNALETIPLATWEELILVVTHTKRKKSRDAHGLSSSMFQHLDQSHWHSLLDLFNSSFRSAVLPLAWKDSRMILFAKKEPICTPANTRPISILDAFQKIAEKLFLTRFKAVLNGRGLLPPEQSGFREGHRLQTRLLLFLEDLRSLMSNSSPTTTLFIDFKSAFDLLWQEGCLGKLAQMGIPPAFLNWTEAWLDRRKGYIEINGSKSRWFAIERGSPQGGVLSPSLFIAFHADMPSYLSWCTSHLFADDLAAIVAGRIGIRYTAQCIDIERRLKLLLDQLESYALLCMQPVNIKKTVGLWSARAIGSAPFDLELNDEKLIWVSEFKYLGYTICPKLGWGKMIQHSKLKIRQRTSAICALRLDGETSAALRRALFSAFVSPLFSWIFPIFPLFTATQRNDLEHFYYTCLKRIFHCSEWDDLFFCFVHDEASLSDNCAKYWQRYLVHLADSIDGTLLLEKAVLNEWREAWVNREFTTKCLRTSKRFIHNESMLAKILSWTANQSSLHSVPLFEMEEVDTLSEFPDSFLPYIGE